MMNVVSFSVPVFVFKPSEPRPLFSHKAVCSGKVTRAIFAPRDEMLESCKESSQWLNHSQLYFLTQNMVNTASRGRGRWFQIGLTFLLLYSAFPKVCRHLNVKSWTIMCCCSNEQHGCRDLLPCSYKSFSQVKRSVFSFIPEVGVGA